MLTPDDLVDLAAECRERGDEHWVTQCLIELQQYNLPPERVEQLLHEAGLDPLTTPKIRSISL
jgi:hypothetical protein